MTDSPKNLYFERVDKNLNMARFYALWTQPTLFGEVSLVRNWGRIGTSGRQLVLSFGDETQAGAALGRMAARKERRGYRPISRN